MCAINLSVVTDSEHDIHLHTPDQSFFLSIKKDNYDNNYLVILTHDEFFTRFRRVKKLVQKGKETKDLLFLIYICLMPVLVRVIKVNGNPRRPNMIMIEENMLLGQAQKS